MIDEIVHLIVTVIDALFVCACLLRAWMQWQRIGFRNDVGATVMALSDWIVRPLRRVIPAAGGVDWASIIAAYAISAASVLLVDLYAYAAAGFAVAPPPEQVLGLGLVWLLKWTLYLGEMIVIVGAALSWFNPYSPLLPVFAALGGPLMRPIRKVLPTAGRIDFSPMIVIVLLQIAVFVLQKQSMYWFGVF
jgi:YggT family protein